MTKWQYSNNSHSRRFGRGTHSQEQLIRLGVCVCAIVLQGTAAKHGPIENMMNSTCSLIMSEQWRMGLGCTQCFEHFIAKEYMCVDSRAPAGHSIPNFTLLITKYGQGEDQKGEGKVKLESCCVYLRNGLGSTQPILLNWLKDGLYRSESTPTPRSTLEISPSLLDMRRGMTNLKLPISFGLPCTSLQGSYHIEQPWYCLLMLMATWEREKTLDGGREELRMTGPTTEDSWLSFAPRTICIFLTRRLRTMAGHGNQRTRNLGRELTSSVYPRILKGSLGMVLELTLMMSSGFHVKGYPLIICQWPFLPGTCNHMLTHQRRNLRDGLQMNTDGITEVFLSPTQLIRHFLPIRLPPSQWRFQQSLLRKLCNYEQWCRQIYGQLILPCRWKTWFIIKMKPLSRQCRMFFPPSLFSPRSRISAMKHGQKYNSELSYGKTLGEHQLCLNFESTDSSNLNNREGQVMQISRRTRMPSPKLLQSSFWQCGVNGPNGQSSIVKLGNVLSKTIEHMLRRLPAEPMRHPRRITSKSFMLASMFLHPPGLATIMLLKTIMGIGACQQIQNLMQWQKCCAKFGAQLKQVKMMCSTALKKAQSGVLKQKMTQPFNSQLKMFKQHIGSASPSKQHQDGPNPQQDNKLQMTLWQRTNYEYGIRLDCKVDFQCNGKYRMQLLLTNLARIQQYHRISGVSIKCMWGLRRTATDSIITLSTGHSSRAIRMSGVQYHTKQPLIRWQFCQQSYEEARRQVETWQFSWGTYTKPLTQLIGINFSKHCKHSFIVSTWYCASKGDIKELFFCGY